MIQDEQIPLYLQVTESMGKYELEERPNSNLQQKLNFDFL